MKNYKKTYKEIYSKVDIEKVFKYYDIDFSRTYYGSSGEEYLIRCPFPDHEDLTPSFSFNISTGVWNCFVCGGGDFFKFIKNIESFDTIDETVSFIRNLLGINEKKGVDFDFLDHSFEKFSENKKEYKKNLSEEYEIKEVKLPESSPAEDFYDIVKSRVSLENIKRWGMRYCHEPVSKYQEKYRGRLIIPVYYENKLVTFAARDMTGRSKKWEEIKTEIKEKKYDRDKVDELVKKYECKKYLYPFGSPLMYVFFNWDEAKKNREYVILVEGILDAIRLVEYGYNVVSIFNCNLNDYKISKLITTFETIYVALDNDNKVDANGVKKNPGQESARKIMNEKLDDVEVYNILLPVGKDPDDCSKSEFDECFKEAKNNAKKIFTF